MSQRDLAGWLSYLEQLHPTAIDMGLERSRQVATQLGLGRPAPLVITVTGTNGKGSTCAFLASLLTASGLKVGVYSSPHLLRYNERVRIDGVEVDDASLVAALEAVEAARGDTPLTYFEYATLAALDLFERAGLDLALLEVGLGGRLDATNLVDADVAVITTVDLDHMDYLGPDRESIGVEKAGILRAGKIAVLGEKDPPSSVLRRAYALGAIAIRGHSDYLVDRHDDHWVWREPGFQLDLPYPALAAPVQVDNAAAAVAALRASSLPIPDDAFKRGVMLVEVPGRFQVLPGRPAVVLDVAHNPQAAGVLADNLGNMGFYPETWAVLGMLADKDVAGVVQALAGAVDGWHVAGLADAGPRGQGVDAVADPLAGTDAAAMLRPPYHEAALQAAMAQAGPGGRVLVFGSFHTAAAALEHFGASG